MIYIECRMLAFPASLRTRALTMNQAVSLTPQMFGIGSGIFFFGYLAFEVPSTLILHRVGARFWMAGS